MRCFIGKSLLFLNLVLIFASSCSRLQHDNSIAYPLVAIAVSPTPAFEDIRNFIQRGDLIYAAAGSGGILVYRIVGDSMDPVLPLSLTNLYSEELEQVYIRTVEMLETETMTNLIYAYDTLSGGGIGIAEITPESTKPIGSLITAPNLRIKHTITSFNPQGIYHILATTENIGIVSYDLSFISNSNFELPQIASLVDLVASLDIDRPAQQFLSLAAPGALAITNISQITDLDSLVNLALNNPTLFSSVISNIPFIPEQQREQLQQILTVTNQALLSNILNTAQGIFGTDVIKQVDPQLLNTLLSGGAIPNLAAQQGIDLAGQIQSNLTPQIVAEIAAQMNSDTKIPTDLAPEDLQNIISLSGLQQVAQNQTILEMPIVDQKTDTLFEESLLSNINLAGDIDTSIVHNESYNPFANRRQVGDARLEIQRTVDSLGRTFFVAENEDLKNRLLALGDEEAQRLFSILFKQADLALSLIPILENSGINIREIYDYWVQGDYVSIINSVDTAVIAELLRQLPRYQVQTQFDMIKTNISVPSIKNVYADVNTLYIAAGIEGFFIVDRLSWEVISFVKKPFSDVTSVIPHKIYGNEYYIVTDKLDGLLLYEKKSNRRVGEQVTRIALVGESFSVYPYEDILWVADGSNGVLAIRFDKDKSLTIEAELYQKNGIAYYIGAARRREVLASYGADGLQRLRITNISSGEAIDLTTLAQDANQEKPDDFFDRVLIWSEYSSFAQFLRRIFLL
ncbi:MAG: hypothetical protein ACRCWI_00680 [Brevinema sp.]